MIAIQWLFFPHADLIGWDESWLYNTKRFSKSSMYRSLYSLANSKKILADIFKNSRPNQICYVCPNFLCPSFTGCMHRKVYMSFFSLHTLFFINKHVQNSLQNKWTSKFQFIFFSKVIHITAFVPQLYGPNFMNVILQWAAISKA